jgi:hypothetical protein
MIQAHVPMVAPPTNRRGSVHNDITREDRRKNGWEGRIS